MSDARHARQWLERVGIPADRISDAGARCAGLLDAWLMGLHHLPVEARKIDWSGEWVELTFWSSFSTFDFDELTRLVFLAHDHCIRAEISAAMRYLRVSLYPRVRDGLICDRHPALEKVMADWREHHAGGMERKEDE
jgi:hypothetical protein